MDSIHKVFVYETGYPMDIFVQGNTESLQERAEVLRALVESNGGRCVSDSEDARVVVVLDTNSQSGKNLIAKYSVRDPTKEDTRGVVDESWIMACIKNCTRFDGDPHWGGHYLLRHDHIQTEVPAPLKLQPADLPLPASTPSTPVASATRPVDTQVHCGTPQARTDPHVKVAEQQRQCPDLPRSVTHAQFHTILGNSSNRPVMTDQSFMSSAHSQPSRVQPPRVASQALSNDGSLMSRIATPPCASNEPNAKSSGDVTASRGAALSNFLKRSAPGNDAAEDHGDDSRPLKLARKSEPLQPTLIFGSLTGGIGIVHGQGGKPYTDSETQALVTFIALNKDLFWTTGPPQRIWTTFAEEIGSKRSGAAWRACYNSNKGMLKLMAEKLPIRRSEGHSSHAQGEEDAEHVEDTTQTCTL